MNPQITQMGADYPKLDRLLCASVGVGKAVYTFPGVLFGFIARSLQRKVVVVNLCESAKSADDQEGSV